MVIKKKIFDLISKDLMALCQTLHGRKLGNQDNSDHLTFIHQPN